MFNRYKIHHKILGFLKSAHSKVYIKHIVDAKASYSSEYISKVINEDFYKTEVALYELSEMNCVKYSKSNNEFIILELGITKHENKYFLFKQKEYFKIQVKDYLGIIVSVLAILTFFISVWMNRK